MATNAYIGLFDGSQIEYVYCHWDGYIDHVGKILYSYYNSEERVRELLKYGNMSFLGRNIDPDPSKEHTFQNPQKDVCIFYGRDRGETDQKSESSTSGTRFARIPKTYYAYVFDTTDNTWYFSKNKSSYDGVPLSNVLNETKVITKKELLEKAINAAKKSGYTIIK